MPTDTERREVAENLRYLADYPGAPVQYAEQFRDELSAVVLPDGFTHDYPELLQRLADLIEPSIPADPGEAGLASVDAFVRERTGKPVDRDALLALADEIEDNDVTYCVSAQYVLDSYARRIREALGVADG